MDIVEATAEEAEAIAHVISESNKDVAKAFGLTYENNPKHPSFCTADWVLADLDRGVNYFLYKKNNRIAGCVAYESPSPDLAYLNRLSVLPNYRCNGIGERLVQYLFRHAKSKKIKTISIGIIAAHVMLRNWYLKLGFVAGDIKTFPHLPFDVQYMSYELDGG